MTMPDPYVRFWIDQQTGVELACLNAAEFRHGMVAGATAIVERDQLRERLARAERSQNEMDIMRVTINSQKEWVDGCHRELKVKDERLALAELVVADAVKEFRSARSALGDGRCLDAEQCEACETERQDARDYLDLGLLRLARLDEVTPA